MNLAELLSRVVTDTVGKTSILDPAKYWTGSHLTFLDGSLMMFLPELVISATIVLLLFVRLFNADRIFPGSSVALFGSIVALLLSVFQALELNGLEELVSQSFFTGLL